MLDKLILRALLTMSLALSFTGAANAALITQDFISDTTGSIIGSITINTTPSSDAGNGLREVLAWEELNFFGFDMLAPVVADANDFYASFDAADFSLGLQDFAFDVDDTSGLYAASGEFFFGAGEVNLFHLVDSNFDRSDTYSVSAATVVPTPATLVLFLTAIAGLAARRKNS